MPGRISLWMVSSIQGETARPWEVPRMPASDRLRELGFEVAVPKIVERSMRTPGALARAIRDRRRDLGWTVERLARESGVDRSELEALELDGRGRYAAARSVIAALGISPSSLPHPRSMREGLNG